jgi:type II secretory pathway pseudopilin PulG
MNMLQFIKKHPKGSILIEAIAALTILAIITAISAPAILIALLTRVESKRISQARQLAQQQVDSIQQLLANSESYSSSSLPPSTGSTSTSNLVPAAAPSDISTCTSIPCSTSAQAAIVPLNNTNFLIQTFRTTGVSRNAIDSTIAAGSSLDVPVAFRLGVRVYGPRAITYFQKGGALQSAESSSSTGLQSSQVNEAQYPLATLYVNVVKSNLSKSQAAYTQLLTQ